MFSVRNPDGSIFVAERRAALEPRGFFGFPSVESLWGWFEERWNRAIAAKQPETERMIRNDLLYQGFHYEDFSSNRNRVVNNLPFMLIESWWSILVETLPRPEPVPMRGAKMSGARERAIRETATWFMETTEWQYCYEQGTRWKGVHGWHPHVIVFDDATGMPYPKPLSAYDFYRDPSSTSEDDMEYYFIAGPVPTEWLRDQFPRDEFPHLFDQNGKSKIQPDGWLSPGYFSFVRPFYQMSRGIYGTSPGPSAVRHVSDPGQPASTTTTKLSPPYGAVDSFFAETTYFVQMFARDRRVVEVPYRGKLVRADGVEVPGAAQVIAEPAARSGWTCIQFDASGLYYDNAPVDECFGGMNLVIGRVHDQRPYRFESPGVIDPIAPLVRSINRRHHLLNSSLEFEALPLLVVDRDSGATVDHRFAKPGEKVKKARGSELKWLKYEGASQGQFALLELEHRLVDKIAGSPDAQRGARPVGIEAAAALRQLKMAADTRIRAQEASAQREYARLLKKLLVCLGHKLRRPLLFKATDGEPVYVTKEDLLSGYDIRFAWGSGLTQTRSELEEKALGLFQSGLIDEEAVLEAVDWRGREEILARMQLRREREMMVQLAMSRATGAGGGSQNGGRPQPATAGR